MNNKICSIYALLDPDTNEIRYVGQTIKTLEQRLSRHIDDSQKNKHAKNNYVYKWIRSLLKQNKRPIISLLQNNAIWNESEIKWIKCLKEDGYRLTNTTNGGEGALGRILSEQEIQKKRINATGNQWMLGKKHSSETKRKISQGQIGKLKPLSADGQQSYSEKRGRKVKCIDTNIVYPAINQAAKSVGCHRGAIAHAIRNNYKANGYRWEYV